MANSLRKNYKFKNKRHFHHKGKDHKKPDQDSATKSSQLHFEKLFTETNQQLALWHQESEQLKTHASDQSFQLDPWQKYAFDELMLGHSAIVDAPTTAGKTRIVECFFKENINKPHFRAAYTTPVKSLSNDKLREFRAMFGKDMVGIATGDIKENLSAPIVVATLESYRNSLLGTEPDLGRSLVVFDEYHFLQDESRGSAWEEAIILTPEHCQLLLLSASVANSNEFCDWLSSIRNTPCKLIEVNQRPVPLKNLIYYGDHWLLAEEIPKSDLIKSKRTAHRITVLPLKKIADRCPELIQLKLTPCILYSGKRLACKQVAMELCKVLPAITTPLKDNLCQRLNELHQELQCMSFLGRELKYMITQYGVAYHHSGLAPPARIAIEILVKEGLLLFCAATMGLSVGINFSVRSAMITDFQRPSDFGLIKYPPSDVLQMLGRAGRRGKDCVGFSLWPSLDSYLLLGDSQHQRCESNLKNDPTTFMGLVSRGFDLEKIEQFYNRSFRRYKERTFDLALLTPRRLKKKLKTETLPCQSPTYEFAHFLNDEKALCYNCIYRDSCHEYIDAKMQGELARLHIHLHAIQALNAGEQLTEYGHIAKHFPQSGGLLFAKWLAEKKITRDNLGSGVELVSACCLAAHKSPLVDKFYKLPFNVREVEKYLQYFYPIDLFPELYDPPYGKRHYPIFKEFNPDAGYIINMWLKGYSWKELCAHTVNEKFAEGDLMALLYRIATYLQSLAQANIGEISSAAVSLRQEILREPLSIALYF